MSSITDDIFNKVNSHKGIEAVIISDMEGVPIRSTINDENKDYAYTAAALAFIKKCKPIINELIEEDPVFFRIRTKFNELMISYENDFIIIVVQNPASNS